MRNWLLRLAPWFYGSMLAAGIAGLIVWWATSPALDGEGQGHGLGVFLAFDLWIRAGWQHRFWVIVGLNMLLGIGAGWLTVVWRPAGWLFLGIFGSVMLLGSLTTGAVGLFVAFLPTLVLETLAVLLCVSAGLALNERRVSAGRSERWLTPSDAWVLLAVLLCLVPAGFYEAYFIANILPLS
jgi:hypothetical protein